MARHIHIWLDAGAYVEEKHKREATGQFGASEHIRKPGAPVTEPDQEGQGQLVYISFGKVPVMGTMMGPDPKQPENMIVVIGEQKMSVHGSRIHETFEEAEAMLARSPSKE
jgi:hypothetical protein